LLKFVRKSGERFKTGENLRFQSDGSSSRGPSTETRRRRAVRLEDIGQPSDFRHLAHLGHGDVVGGNAIDVILASSASTIQPPQSNGDQYNHQQQIDQRQQQHNRQQRLVASN
jgi:hypothetical protein